MCVCVCVREREREIDPFLLFFRHENRVLSSDPLDIAGLSYVKCGLKKKKMRYSVLCKPHTVERQQLFFVGNVQEYNLCVIS